MEHRTSPNSRIDIRTKCHCADLGTLQSYRLECTLQNNQRLEELETVALENPYQSGRVVTDLAGGVWADAKDG